MMPDTEWLELIENRWNVLVDANKNLIIDKALNHKRSSNIPDELYGGGDAGEKIVEIINNF